MQWQPSQWAQACYLSGGSDGQDEGGNGGAAEVEQTTLRAQDRHVSASSSCSEPQRLVHSREQKPILCLILTQLQRELTRGNLNDMRIIIIQCHQVSSGLLPQPEGWLFCRQARSRGPLGSALSPRSAPGCEGLPRDTQWTACWGEVGASGRLESRYEKTILSEYQKVALLVFLFFTWNYMCKRCGDKMA